MGIWGYSLLAGSPVEAGRKKKRRERRGRWEWSGRGGEVGGGWVGASCPRITVNWQKAPKGIFVLPVTLTLWFEKIGLQNVPGRGWGFKHLVRGLAMVIWPTKLQFKLWIGQDIRRVFKWSERSRKHLGSRKREMSLCPHASGQFMLTITCSRSLVDLRKWV